MSCSCLCPPACRGIVSPNKLREPQTMPQQAPQSPPRSFWPELATTWRLAWPIMGTQLLSLSMSVVDTVFVGRLGQDSLAALAIGGNYAALVNLVVVSILTAVGTLMAERWAQAQRSGPSGGGFAQVNALIKTDILLALGMGAAGFFFLYFPETPLGWWQQPVPLVQLATPYLRWLAIGLPGYCLFQGLRQVCEGSGRAIPTIVTALVATLTNMVLNYGLVFGKLGMPELGLEGAGLATAVVQWLMAAALWVYLFWAPRYRNLRAALLLRGGFDWQEVWGVLRVGLPMSVASACEMGFFVTCTMASGWISVVAQAAHQVAINGASMAFMIPLGLSFAVSVRVGDALGDKVLIRLRAHVALLLSATLAVINGLVFALANDWILAFYTSDPEVIQLGKGLLLIAAVFQVVDGLQVVGLGILRGLKDTRVPSMACLVAFWGFGFPTALVLAFYWQLGIAGLWWGMFVGLSLAAVAHHIRFRLKMAPQ